MGRVTRRFHAFVVSTTLVIALGATGIAAATAQDDTGPEAPSLDDPALIESVLETLSEEIEQTDALIDGLERAQQQGYPAFVLQSGRVLMLTDREATLLVAMTRSRGGQPADVVTQFHLAETFAEINDRERGRDISFWTDDVSGEELDAYWERLAAIYANTEEQLRDRRERLVDVIDELGTLAEQAEAIALGADTGQGPDEGPDDAGEAAADGDLASTEGPHRDVCVFRTGYFLDRSRFSETRVVAWRKDDFDPTWARFDYSAAFPDDDAEDPNHRIEKMRQDVYAIDDATVVFDGGFAGFCSWAASTCPGTTPKFGGEPVCLDGRPVTD